MRTAVVSIDPKTGGVKAYYGGTDANGFDFAQAGSADGVVVQGVRLGRRAAAGHGPGLPGGQLAGDDQRHHDQQRRGRRLRHLQHRRGAEALAEHQLLPADAQAEERARRRRRRPRTRRASPRASPAWTTRCPRTARVDRPTTESCWASTRLACWTWRRRTRRSRRRACTTSRTSCRRWSTPQGEVLFDASQQDNERRAAHRQEGRRQRHLRDAADRRVLQRPQPGRRPAVGGQDRHRTSSATPAPTVTRGWSASRRRCRRRSGSAPPRAPSRWRTAWGSPVYGSGLPSDIWKSTMDGALEDTENESFPKPEEIGGYAGVPQAPPPPPPPPIAAPAVRRR